MPPKRPRRTDGPRPRAAALSRSPSRVSPAAHGGNACVERARRRAGRAPCAVRGWMCPHGTSARQARPARCHRARGARAPRRRARGQKGGGGELRRAARERVGKGDLGGRFGEEGGSGCERTIHLRSRTMDRPSFHTPSRDALEVGTCRRKRKALGLRGMRLRGCAHGGGGWNPDAPGRIVGLSANPHRFGDRARRGLDANPTWVGNPGGRLFSAVEVTQTALGIPRRRLRSLGSRRAHSRSEAKSFCGESSFFCDNTVRARAGVSTRVAEFAGGGREGEGEHRDGGVHGRWRRVAGWRAAHIRGAEDFAVRVYQQRFFAALTPRVPRTEFISARCAVRGARVYQPRPQPSQPRTDR